MFQDVIGLVFKLPLFQFKIVWNVLRFLKITNNLMPVILHNSTRT